MRVLVATRSAGKQRELRALFEAAGHEAEFPDDIGLWPEAAEDRLETADSFAENARRKAEYFARRSQRPTVADDSGLEVLYLGGAPGVRSRRFAGLDGPDEDVAAANNAELLRRLAGAAGHRRAARYRCVLAYYPAPGAGPLLFEGACAGQVLEEPRGTGGFGYDPLFLSVDLGKSFAEATPEEKASVSHRGRAFAALLDHLSRESA